ncbi:MAG: PEP-CTERM sorting domain-containing protein [Verrucomicrobiota bacterium]
MTPRILFSCAILGISLTAQAADILAPGDFIFAIDSDLSAPASGFPAGENPTLILDGNSGSKYLNTGGNGAGFIVTPTAGSVVKSFVLTTANDGVNRDPAYFQLFGTNDAIQTASNGTGLGLENWTPIASGALSLPATRQVAASAVNFTNATNYTSYKMVFPTLQGDGLFQIADAQFFTESNGGGTGVLAIGNPIIGIDAPASQSRHFVPEGAANLLDGNSNSKYLNFGRENSGFVVTPAVGASIVTSFTLTTANDFFERDPASYSLFGFNGDLTSFEGSFGTDEAWTLINSGTLDASNVPETRLTAGTPVTFDNLIAYENYKLIFNDNRSDAGGGNSIQVADVQFQGAVVPEPGTVLLSLVGLVGLAARRRRRC